MLESKRRGRPSKDVSNSDVFTIRDSVMEPFYVVRDANNWTIMEQYKPTRGWAGKAAKNEMKERVIAYYTTFPNAINRISKLKFSKHKGDYASIQEYMNEYKGIKEGMNELLGKITI